MLRYIISEQFAFELSSELRMKAWLRTPQRNALSSPSFRHSHNLQPPELNHSCHEKHSRAVSGPCRAQKVTILFLDVLRTVLEGHCCSSPGTIAGGDGHSVARQGGHIRVLQAVQCR